MIRMGNTWDYAFSSTYFLVYQIVKNTRFITTFPLSLFIHPLFTLIEHTTSVWDMMNYSKKKIDETNCIPKKVRIGFR